MYVVLMLEPVPLSPFNCISARATSQGKPCANIFTRSVLMYGVRLVLIAAALFLGVTGCDQEQEESFSARENILERQ